MATLKRWPSRRGEGVPDGTAGEAAAPDLRHQTLASARNPKGFGGAWRVHSSRPGGVGLDDRTQQRWPGAEGGQKWDSGVFRGFADRVSEPPRHATPRHATPRHATPRHAGPYQ
ncbi:hypothetical protein [Enterobacter kobei]|uniref:hypothetical protein n=1 Tax=Enterobacter kobei TaxID=208224 RepID=UPI00388E55E2